MQTDKIHVFWFRRDLRLEDNAGLHHALKSGRQVLAVFIFDTDILKRFPDPEDRRVDYIRQALVHIDKEMQKYGSALRTFYGNASEVFQKITASYTVDTVFCNRDYEPRALQRDRDIKTLLKSMGTDFRDFKDQVIFEKDEIVKNDGTPYTVFTPYSKKWKDTLKEQHYAGFPLKKEHLMPLKSAGIHRLEDIGFRKTDITFTPPVIDTGTVSAYDKFRDYPAKERTTGLGIALRFGTISIRKCIRLALQYNDTWLDELIWREFFMQILYHFPWVEHRCFKEKYEHIAWRNNEKEFRLWCNGKTGYPIVDAGMRQLNSTGQMHNRVRMITASFLTKHLLIDWRWGEAYFARKLLDYDMAANNGNWQWAAGCGCDAAPYFRIFNPYAQAKKFDRDLHYVRRWYPDFEADLSPPVVEHHYARKRALDTYKKGLGKE
ncbi:cryptochrome/photolyase family protein [Sinomicrobium soli]|uniref:cryptochrome/photolyase family protein n=1 Tax=Sinomicrobium sp. N-1-3-6 TaxID=2219864 RepID=UPI000DCF0EA9|nr:deoxyribodipyrimidine photo-lyase [Sinomicrobium sp. N-1-3-6]RAV29082.1 deoxyribodipyrimidine photo-lyase [Sinomicrobium sp. N-1-3-6]